MENPDFPRLVELKLRTVRQQYDKFKFQLVNLSWHFRSSSHWRIVLNWFWNLQRKRVLRSLKLIIGPGKRIFEFFFLNVSDVLWGYRKNKWRTLFRSQNASINFLIGSTVTLKFFFKFKVQYHRFEFFFFKSSWDLLAQCPFLLVILV